MDKEGIVNVIKKLILPELEAIKGNQAKMEVRLDAIEKRISDMNGHLLDQSRRIDDLRTELTAKIDDVRTDLSARIDDTNKRIDDLRTELTAKIDDVKTDLTARIDETNKRVDQLTFQVGKVAKEMERIKRDQVVTADIFTRIGSLEKKTAHL